MAEVQHPDSPVDERPPPLACSTCGSLNTVWIGDPPTGTLCAGCGRTWGV